MRLNSAQKFILAVVVSLMIALFSWLAYRQSILSVIEIDRYIVIGVDGGYVSSSDGKTKLRITYLDGGATHSGNFWTYITVSDWLNGTRVLAEGFSSYSVRYGRAPFSVEWVDEKTFWITFVEGRSEVANRKIIHVE